jgi:hypothetical protein
MIGQTLPVHAQRAKFAALEGRSMHKTMLIMAAAASLALSSCATPVGPVEVTRFHAPDIAPLGKGAIAVEPAPGSEGTSLEWQSYKGAVLRQLLLLGYFEAPAGAASAQVAELRLARTTFRPERASGPVSVGIGGSTGSYGSGVGLGIGLNLSPKPAEQVETELGVMIKDRSSGQSLWEGRASFTVSVKSPLAGTGLAAPKLAAALFQGFPGTSGETIAVK